MIEHCCNFDLTELVGTRRRAAPGLSFAATKLGGACSVDAGCARGLYTNSPAGTSFALQRRFQASHIRRVAVPPASLHDQGFALRLGSAGSDFSPVALYYPPKTKERRKQAHYEATVVQLNRWLGTSLAEGEDTFYGERDSSMTDSVLAPADVSRLVHGSGVHPRLGRRLQHIKTRAIRDHLPLFLELDKNELPVPRANCKPTSGWNREGLMMAVTSGVRRATFCREICDYLEAHRTHRSEFLELAAPDPFFAWLESAFAETRQKYFGGRKPLCARLDYRADAAWRAALLRELRELPNISAIDQTMPLRFMPSSGI
ncbi:unnamed protein product [Prorocentrum cordatum]|uniref:Uncharacterized protein n=1 Tax=Prorocentrum cordatum TaxID=2364126 RepID=A0ABN9TTB4_9DINO|nr:unnamed protein product [Polarella glacialis]